jgi:hypothetical protein
MSRFAGVSLSDLAGALARDGQERAREAGQRAYATAERQAQQIKRPGFSYDASAPNPFSRKSVNLTAQSWLLRHAPDIARRLQVEVEVIDALAKN